ncbi:MAG: hypothetical protein C0481_16730 [Phenylobacterium sp.]|uniref:DUF6356 family protein n=1 Tax=Phenylobacterium sp. TaxID=1871053 RepID=UPI0025FF3A2F|nr:DUF6356 family protein [Phenylobacterium sp.]MBA4013510.1 hypothetical protein [Phenylobacterium sp.]
MLDAFNRHPSSVGESYGQHLAQASGFGMTMITAGVACLVHAVFPFLFEKTASLCVQRLHAQMAARGRQEAPAHKALRA